ncbi:MAG: PQQ-dependent sugar dehydrogenase [Balneola sp.]
MSVTYLKRSLSLFLALLYTGFLFQPYAQDFVLSNGTEVTMRTLSTDIHRPWDIEVLPDNKILVTERDSGFVSMFDLQTGQKTIVYRFADEERVNPDFGTTAGILGMLVHPDFSGSQPFVYVAYTSADFTQALARFRYDGSQLVEREILIVTEDAPSNHGSRLALLPDSTILMTTGSDNVPLAQDTTSLVGKVLRFRLDGSAPFDNPFYNENDPTDPRSYIYSMGHRNAQGITVVNDQSHPFHGNIYASEHGSRQNDEINFIEAGKNYGWPNFEGWTSQSSPENEPPMVTFDLAPTGIAWYNHPAIPEWSNKLIMGTSKGQQMVVWDLNEEGDGITNIDTTLSTSNNAVIQNGEHSFLLFFDGHLTRPRCITPLDDGRILLGLWSEAPGEPDRVAILSNDAYQPAEIAWSVTEVQFGSVDRDIMRQRFFLGIKGIVICQSIPLV